ncbi:MAG: 2-hydroxychromene-2-carboxylate isomerase [Bdellovibrionales bacterium]|jgi:2-hydroxychromene-2-carboxylate isomerase|nr:2-hydroxychromene-2-carboxylate isomerase [Bdellovibrionales bacterium]
MGKKLNFYFDFLSPYSYLAWKRIKEYDYDVEYIPVVLSKIIKSYDTKGPAEIDPKRNFLMKDLLRKCKENKIPFCPPGKLPFNSLYALRFSLKGVSGDNQKNLIDMFFKTSWGEGGDIDSEEAVKSLLERNGLTNFEQLLEKSSTKEARIELKNNITSALKEGVFGVPSIVVDEELFWGVESLDHLELYLQGKDLLPYNEYQNFLESYQN